MKILIIGSGGREHAFAWKIAQSPNAQMIFLSPGNGGTALDKRFKNISMPHFDDLVKFVIKENIELTIVGPEMQLASGIVNLFRACNLKIYGPTQEAAQLESSKKFAKAFMNRYGIPTPKYEIFSKIQNAYQYVKNHKMPVVIKSDQLAAGKGVIVAMTLAEANHAIEFLLLSKKNQWIIIEEFVSGREYSFIVMVDHKLNFLPLAISQDYKTLKDNNQGPNTGGMGAYSSSQILSPMLQTRIINEIIIPAIQGMAKDGIPFSGFLYAGIIIDKFDCPRILEFNCRMGDPETQSILVRLKTDFLDVLQHAMNGTLNQVQLEWDDRTAVCVVIAAPGYPNLPTITGSIIFNIPIETRDCITFHANTSLLNHKDIIVSGGRVLSVVGLGKNIQLARKKAYSVAQNINFYGAYMRHDIGL